MLPPVDVDHERFAGIDQLGPAGVIVEQVRLTEQVDPRLEKIAKSIPKSPKEMSRLRRRMMQAGIYSFRAAVIYSVAEIVLPILFAIPPLRFMLPPMAWITSTAPCFALSFGRAR